MKRLVWIGDSRKRLGRFPPEAMRKAGFELEQVQWGADPSNWKPMPSVGLSVREIRVNVAGAFRVVYIANFEEAVYVLHAFQKKSRATPAMDIELARLRLRGLIANREGR